MRRYLVLLASMLMAWSVQANDPPPSKPIKSASAKEEASGSASASASASTPAPAKEERKSSSKENKESAKEAAARAKEALVADELAARIADRLSVIRKEKDDAAARSMPKPVVRSSYAPPVKRPDATKTKGEHGANGMAAGAMEVPHGEVHWNYQGEGGPLNWGKINPANAKCDIGERQSPIDIRDGIKVDLDPIAFDYRPSRFTVVDNGHTIQVNIGAGNYINVLGHNYELVQFHFHKPSEERVNGKSFEMVAHLVHKDTDGKLAVVAVLIERGKAHSLVQHVWNNLPLEKNDPVQALTTMDMNDILPVKRDYYTYMGSLTTPPCTEGVLWLVMKEPIEISPDQLGIFSRLYPMNARPIQKNSGRLIKESN